MTNRRAFALLVLPLVLACRPERVEDPPDASVEVTWALAGTVTGLRGAGLVLANGDERLVVAADGPVSFGRLLDGAPYDVQVQRAPELPTQRCEVANGAAAAATADVTFTVTCTTERFLVGGGVEGLRGTGLALVLDPGGEELPVREEGAFAFTTPVASGDRYTVTLARQPAGPSQTCVVEGGTGTVLAGDVTSVRLRCETDRFPVGGTVTGLAGTLTVSSGNGNAREITADGPFTLPDPIASGAAYAIALEHSLLPAQDCQIARGAGVVGAAAVEDIEITCTTKAFALGVVVRGLRGGGLTLLSGAQRLSVPSNGAHAFPLPVASGTDWTIDVERAPLRPSQRCTVTPVAGRIADADVLDVEVACRTNAFTVGGEVRGLVGTISLKLGAEVVSVAANGPFAFPTPLESGAAYAVEIPTPPAGQDCVVTSGIGTVGASPVEDVVVACAPRAYALGGRVDGLAGVLVLQEGGAELRVTASGAFAFPQRLPFGSPYAVGVKEEPAGQRCTVARGTGVMGAGDVASVTVTCVDRTFALGGRVDGLVGRVVLQNGGAEAVVDASGPFAFTAPVAFRAPYDVTVKTQPEGLACVVAGGQGAMPAGPVSSVVVTCTPLAYALGGVVRGLAGTLAIANGDDTLLIAADGGFAFAKRVAFGAAYDVVVTRAPDGQECQVRGGRGSMGAGVVSSVEVVCTNLLYSLGGSVTGLGGTLELATAAGDRVTVTASGRFTFPVRVPFGSAYAVSVVTEPPTQSCRVSAGSGRVPASDVTSIAVACLPRGYTLGGTLSGALSSVVVANGPDELLLPGEGPFEFFAPVPAGAAYEVKVVRDPRGQACSVARGSGVMGGTPVKDVAVTCVLREYALGGSVTGLRGGRLELVDQDGHVLAITADGAFTFPKLPYLSSWRVQVRAQPDGQECSVLPGSGSGTMGAQDVTGVDVSCEPSLYALGGAVTGLAGTVVAALEGGDALTFTRDGAFTFETRVEYAARWNVVVRAFPDTQTCAFDRTTGVMPAADVLDLVLRCEPRRYAIGGRVRGLAGTLSLKNGADTITLTQDGAFTFPTRVVLGGSYAVTVASAPPAQDCGVSFGNGTNVSADVTNIAITCTAKAFDLGGRVSGLASGTLVLQNGASDELPLTQNGAFTFGLPLESGDGYAVTVKTQPAGHACTVTGGAGTVGTTHVDSVLVHCLPASAYVLRVGSGAAVASGVAAPVFLDELSYADGAPVRSITIPASASDPVPVTLAVSALNDGGLSRAQDGRSLVFAGYNAASGTTGVSATTATAAPRTVVRVEATGALAFTRLGMSAFSTANVRAAATANGSAYWVTGATGGVWYATADGSVGRAVSATFTNTRWAHVVGGDLFVSGAAGSLFGLARVGAALPTIAGAVATALPGFPTASGPDPSGFALLDANPAVNGPDLAYVADERSVANGGGVQKWTFDGATWRLVRTIGVTTGARGLAAWAEPAGHRLLVTTTETTANRLVAILDDGSASPAVTTLRTAPANTVFRGVALAPVP